MPLVTLEQLDNNLDAMLAAIKEYIDGLRVGGRNYALKSDTAKSNNNHCLGTYDVSVPLVAGETYTATICITPAKSVKYVFSKTASVA